jgi:hypothetical protein
MFHGTTQTKSGSSIYAINTLSSDELVQWQPIPEFNRTDADVTLFYLAHNSIVYQSPNTDPWFSANQKLVGTNTYYGLPKTSLMGCIDQYQICDPNRPGDTGCSKLGSMTQVPGITLGLNLHQIATAGRFMETAYDRSMYMSVHGREASALNGKSITKA